ncbi:MAG: hypothetical protein KC680_02030 [Candidatus Peregrinibacteria bacterium]|nr:hypothetical protein [Candidatus Peregrinibacteria bacterium]MCB9808139.1 hypothetical protein [Candidatus Peribacteria bacterium]
MMRLITIIGVFLLSTSVASAHGGNQRIVDEKYIVHLTSAPMFPFTGETTQNTITISDLEENFLSVPLSAEIVLKKNDVTRWESGPLTAADGFIEFAITYPEAGLYELFVQFTFEGDTVTYEPDDFYVQARSPAGTSNNAYILLAGILVGIATCRVLHVK